MSHFKFLLFDPYSSTLQPMSNLPSPHVCHLSQIPNLQTQCLTDQKLSFTRLQVHSCFLNRQANSMDLCKKMLLNRISEKRLQTYPSQIIFPNIWICDGLLRLELHVCGIRHTRLYFEKKNCLFFLFAFSCMGESSQYAHTFRRKDHWDQEDYTV